jgi:hypothetical protein
MRFTPLISALSLALVCLAQDHALQITATLKAKSPRIGEPIVVSLCMKNMGALTRTLVMGNPARNLDFTVLDQNGNEVPLTTDGKWAKARVGFRYFPTLNPGAEIREDVRLDQWVEITKPGRYSLRVKRQSTPDGPIDHSRWTPSESNTLTFVVMGKPPTAQSTKTTDVSASLSVQLVYPDGKPLERQSLVMRPTTEGYSDAVEKGPFFADRDGKVLVDSLVPGRHRFVTNQEWRTPTFLEFVVPPEGLTTRATVLSQDTSTFRPDLNVMVVPRTKDGAKLPSLLGVTVSNNNDRPYTLSATDLVLYSIFHRVFPPVPHTGLEVPPKGKGALTLTLDWDEYCSKGLWCSTRGEDIEWPGPTVDDKGIYYRVGVANCYSNGVPLNVLQEMKKRRVE